MRRRPATAVRADRRCSVRTVIWSGGEPRMSTGLTSGQCPACGAAITSGDRACPACGLDLVADELAKIAYTTRFLEWARKYWLLDEQAHARLQRELDKAHSALTGAAWQPAAAPTPAAQPPAPAHAAWPTAPTAGVQPTQPASPAAPPKAQPLAGRTAPARPAPRATHAKPRRAGAWAARLRRAWAPVASDLGLHGLAYLGVLLMFTGTLGLALFSLRSVNTSLRPLAEGSVPLVLLVSSWFLRRRGAPLGAASLELLGGAVLPVLTFASLLDGSGVPPDLPRGPLLVAALAAIAAGLAGVYALVARRHPATTLRYLVAPLAWTTAGVLGLAFHRGPSAAQMALVSAAVAATLLIAHHWRGYQLSRPTEIASVPGAALAIALVLVFAAGEDWPLWPALAATAATLLTVELLAGRLPAASGASLAQSLVLGIGLAAAAPRPTYGAGRPRRRRSGTGAGHGRAVDRGDGRGRHRGLGAHPSDPAAAGALRPERGVGGRARARRLPGAPGTDEWPRTRTAGGAGVGRAGGPDRAGRRGGAALAAGRRALCLAGARGRGAEYRRHGGRMARGTGTRAGRVARGRGWPGRGGPGADAAPPCPADVVRGGDAGVVDGAWAGGCRGVADGPIPGVGGYGPCPGRDGDRLAQPDRRPPRGDRSSGRPWRARLRRTPRTGRGPHGRAGGLGRRLARGNRGGRTRRGTADRSAGPRGRRAHGTGSGRPRPAGAAGVGGSGGGRPSDGPATARRSARPGRAGGLRGQRRACGPGPVVTGCLPGQRHRRGHRGRPEASPAADDLVGLGPDGTAGAAAGRPRRCGRQRAARCPRRLGRAAAARWAVARRSAGGAAPAPAMAPAQLA